MPSLVAAAASSFFRASASSCADAARDGKRRRRHGGDGDSRASKKQAVGRVASPVAHLSCARIRPLVHASRPKVNEEALVVRDGGQEVVAKKENTVESISSKKIEPAVQASRPKDKMTVPSAGLFRNDGVIKTQQKAGERIQATVKKTIPPLSNPSSAMKVRRASVLPKEAHGVIKTKQEASERVQATITKSIPQIRPPAPAAIHQDPHATQDALRAALAAARQARDRRQQNVYRHEREEARRELDKVVRTVFFNDPYISLENVLMSVSS